jgi:hypothetical protein
MGFNYRKVIGETLWPMIKCGPDISPHIIKLSQYLENPTLEHYEVARTIASYLAVTMDEGIYYWRDTPVNDLPDSPLPTLHTDNYTIQTPFSDEGNLQGLVDSDWAGDNVKCKSISGILVMYVGGAIACKSKFQEVIALSTTEAEFVAACDTAKMLLFFCSILDDFGLDQRHTTVLYEDNTGALLMTNAGQPTRRTHHMDIKHFSILDWVERDLLILNSIPTSGNASDAMTKLLTKQLFYRHFDSYMGRRIPSYIQLQLSSSQKKHQDPLTCSNTPDSLGSKISTIQSMGVQDTRT